MKHIDRGKRLIADESRELSAFLNVGFHGDIYLIRIIDSIMTGCEYFIETGTNVGSTLSHMARKYPYVKCLSCEPRKDSFEQACKNTAGLSNVELYNETSQEFIKRIENEKALIFGENVLFWLDAHGYGFEWPLRDEVSFITERFSSGYIFIDDFKVPGMDAFGFDVYKDQICSFDFIEGSLHRRNSYRLFYPNYLEKTSSDHPLIGWGLIEFGHKEMTLSEEIAKLLKGPVIWRFYSQNGEDFLLNEIFKNTRKGFYVEVGCLDGRRFSNTLAFEEIGWSGLCIEAHAEYIDLIRRNRPLSTVCHCAAAEENKDDIIFYANSRGSLSTLDKSQEERWKKDFGRFFSGFQEQMMNQRRLDTLFEEHGVSRIEFLSLDVEGYEREVLRGIDFGKYRPIVILVESDSPEHKKGIEAVLRPAGYHEIGSLGGNIFYATDKSLSAHIKNKLFSSVKLTHTRHPLDSGEDVEVCVDIDTRDKVDLKSILLRPFRILLENFTGKLKLEDR